MVEARSQGEQTQEFQHQEGSWLALQVLKSV
jgi:hypothetical protein